MFINNVAFVKGRLGGKINNAYWQVSKVFGFMDNSGIQTLLKITSTHGVGYRAGTGFHWPSPVLK